MAATLRISESMPTPTLDRPKARKPLRLGTRAASLLLLVVLLGAWELGVRVFHVPKFLIPRVSDIGVALWRGLAISPFAKDSLWYHSAITVTEILLGFFVGSAIGLAIGVVVSQMPKLEAILEPYVSALQSLPKVAVAPIIVVWLGFGIGSKVAIICLLTFFPVLVTSIAGFKAVDTDRIDLLRSLSATPWQIFRKAKFPSALPYIFAGLNMAAAFAVVGAIVGEFVGAKEGLGYFIQLSNALVDTAGMFSAFILLALVGWLLNQAVKLAARKIVFWRRSTVIVESA
jgi:NitT/TauT family transport system permease protein